MKFCDYMAISPHGEGVRLAKAIGVHPKRISEFKYGQRKPLPEQCVALSNATGGKVTPEELNPDVDWKAVRKALRMRR